MRVLKIGRSSSNDIVIKDATVSSQHAALIILDSGEVRIKDLNSKNGTFVNGQRIFQETPVTAKDVLKAGGTVIDWQKYLNAPKPARQFPAIDGAAIKRKKTIGRNSENDIVLAYKDVSGAHAQLIEKTNGDIAIADSGSTNGTYVNGSKISMQILNPGDIVMLANKYPVDWSSVFPKTNQEQQPANPAPEKINKTKILLIAAAAAVVLAAGFLFIQKPFGTRGAELPAGGGALSPEEIYARYKKSVVLIMGAYYFETAQASYSVDEDGEVVRITSYDDAMIYTGTGFIVSGDGKIVTNKHVAAPWEYDDEIIAAIKKAEGNVKVEGKLIFIGCFLNDTNVQGIDDLIPCIPLKTGATNEIDVAVIQTKSKTLPPGTETIVDLNQAVISDDGLAPGTSIFSIGFPAGFVFADTGQGIQANNQDGKITQNRGDFEFGHNISTTGGASGSPIFNEYGKLIGIHHAGFQSTQGYNMAIKAKYAVELLK
ncbi:MAG: FHA domain-containing protein [Termitinemataceae bacterium]|nr:MAG: FHA domain-containing protein [Termitinemataceae bacterium]